MFKLFITNNLFLNGALEDTLRFCGISFDEISFILSGVCRNGAKNTFNKIKNLETIKTIMGNDWGETEIDFIIEIEAFRRKLLEINFDPSIVKVSDTNYILLVGKELYPCR